MLAFVNQRLPYRLATVIFLKGKTMKFTRTTQSHTISLERVLARLAAKEGIDGIALFGSRARNAADPISDYDLLLLVHAPPVDIFQMLTHINHRMADVVFVETAAADRLLEQKERVHARSPEGMLLQKMRRAEIVYDPKRYLARTQKYAQAFSAIEHRLLSATPTELYGIWFWLNHGLSHMQRMVQSSDPVYETAIDLMLSTGLSSICRNYFQIRDLPWQGEKDAVRYLRMHQPRFLTQLRSCLETTERRQKIGIYAQLVEETLKPIGPLWHGGITAVWLRNQPQQAAELDKALTYWDALLA